METLPWLLSLVAVGFWIGLVVEHLQAPPPIPRGWSLSARRAGWLALAVISLAGGAWGPHLWSRTTTDFAREAAGVGVEEAETRGSVVRAPFAVRTRTQILDGDGVPLRSEGTLSLQLPVILLAFFGGVTWLRMRSGGVEPDTEEMDGAPRTDRRGRPPRAVP